MTRQDYGLPGENVGTTNPKHIRVRDMDVAWDSADALPGPLRAVVWSAPFDLDTVEIMDFVKEGRRQGWPMSVLADELLRCLRRAVRENAGDWGPGYPDIPFTPLHARRRRPARRGRLIL